MRTAMERFACAIALAGAVSAMALCGCSTENRSVLQQQQPNEVTASPDPRAPREEAGTESDSINRVYTADEGKVRENSGRMAGSSMVVPVGEGPAEPQAAAPAGRETLYAAEQESYRTDRSAPAPRAGRKMMVPVGCGGDGGPGYAPAPPAPRDNPQHYYRDFGRDRFEHMEVNPVKLVSEEPESTFSIDVDTASYAFVRKSINSGHLPQKDAVRVEEMINYFDYDYELPGDARAPFMPNIAVYPTPWNPDTKLLHIGIKGLELDPRDKPRANLVFLIDVSGSMNHPDKLPLVKNSMRLLLESLGPDDTVGIVTYAGAAGTLLEPTPVRDRHRIASAIERLGAGGSTAGSAGIRQAYALAESNYDRRAVNRVILATDGDFNVGITDREELKGFVERKRESGVCLSVLGFGMGNYNDALMQALAQNGNGNASYIDSLSEARKVLVDEAGSTLFTIAKDVKIQVEFNPARVAEYRLIGYETRMLNREDFKNDKVDAGDVGCGHTVTAIYEITEPGSPACLMDNRVFGEKEPCRKGEDGWYAHLKMRYKLPYEDASRPMDLYIGGEHEYRTLDSVPRDMRFAAAVAAFGQILKGGRYTGGFGLDDVEELARRSRGEDAYGYRSELVSLVRDARSAGAMAATSRNIR